MASTSSNQTTKYPFRAYDYPQFQITFYVIEMLLLCYGVSLCWKIKDIPDAINESQAIAFAMAIIAGVCYMCFPIIISQPPWVNQIIASVGFLYDIALCICSKSSNSISRQRLNERFDNWICDEIYSTS